MILKLIKTKEGLYRSDDIKADDSIDIQQRLMFEHIYGAHAPLIAEWYFEAQQPLAFAHGWGFHIIEE